MKKNIPAIAALVFCIQPLFAQNRTINTMFPYIDDIVKKCIEKESIYLNPAASSGLRIVPAESAGIPSLVPESGDYKYYIEALSFIPAGKNKNRTDIYNALKDIKTLEGRSYYSETWKKQVPLFQEAARIISDKNYRMLPDDIPAEEMPDAEVRFMRLKDFNFGNCYYRADVSKSGSGIYFKLTNFKTLSFLFIPVIKENDLLINYYIEPVAGGIVLYGTIAVRAASYVDKYVDVPSAIVKRIAVINEWIIAGLSG